MQVILVGRQSKAIRGFWGQSWPPGSPKLLRTDVVPWPRRWLAEHSRWEHGDGLESAVNEASVK